MAKKIEKEKARRGIGAVGKSLTELALVTKSVSDILTSVDEMVDRAQVLLSKIENLVSQGQIAALDDDVAVLVGDLGSALRVSRDALQEVQADRK